MRLASVQAQSDFVVRTKAVIIRDILSLAVQLCQISHTDMLLETGHKKVALSATEAHVLMGRWQAHLTDKGTKLKDADKQSISAWYEKVARMVFTHLDKVWKELQAHLSGALSARLQKADAALSVWSKGKEGGSWKQALSPDPTWPAITTAARATLLDASIATKVTDAMKHFQQDSGGKGKKEHRSAWPSINLRLVAGLVCLSIWLAPKYRI